MILKFHLEEQTSERTPDFSILSTLLFQKESKKQWERLALPGIKTNSKATILKTIWCWLSQKQISKTEYHLEITYLELSL